MIEQCYTQIGLAELFDVPVITLLFGAACEESQREAMVIKDTAWREWELARMPRFGAQR